jgi:hypothetical protein
MACDCHLIPSSRGLTVSAISRTYSRPKQLAKWKVFDSATIPSQQTAGYGRTNLANGSFRNKSSVLLWYFLISLSATVPGLYLRFFPCGTGSPAARRNGMLVNFIS